MQIFCKSSSTKIEFQFLQEVHWKTLLPTPSRPDFIELTLRGCRPWLVERNASWLLVFIGMQNLPPWVNRLTQSPECHPYRSILILESAFEVGCIICSSHLALTRLRFHCWSVQLLTSLPDTCVFPAGLEEKCQHVTKKQRLVSWVLRPPAVSLLPSVSFTTSSVC